MRSRRIDPLFRILNRGGLLSVPCKWNIAAWYRRPSIPTQYNIDPSSFVVPLSPTTTTTATTCGCSSPPPSAAPPPSLPPCRVSAPVKDFLRPARPLKKLYSECQKERYRLATFLSRIEAEPGLRRMDCVHCRRGRFFYTFIRIHGYIHFFLPSFFSFLSASHLRCVISSLITKLPVFMYTLPRVPYCCFLTSKDNLWIGRFETGGNGGEGGDAWDKERGCLREARRRVGNMAWRCRVFLSIAKGFSFFFFSLRIQNFKATL